MTPSEKKAFDLMYENLRKLQKHDREMRQNHGYGLANYLCKLIDSAVSTANAALAAADAVAEPPADQLPDAGKMAAALRTIADGTVTGGKSQSYFATVLAYQVLARKTLETDAERMAGARAKYDDSYPGDLLARVEDDPR